MYICMYVCIYIYIYIYMYVYIVYEGRKMRSKVFDSEFHALQSSDIQFFLPKNKRQKILG